jgi:hypothetical protein
MLALAPTVGDATAAQPQAQPIAQPLARPMPQPGAGPIAAAAFAPATGARPSAGSPWIAALVVAAVAGVGLVLMAALGTTGVWLYMASPAVSAPGRGSPAAAATTSGAATSSAAAPRGSSGK